MCSKAGELNSVDSNCLCFFFLKIVTYLFSLSALYNHSQGNAWFIVFLPNSLPTHNSVILLANYMFPSGFSILLCKCQYVLTQHYSLNGSHSSLNTIIFLPFQKALSLVSYLVNTYLFSTWSRPIPTRELGTEKEIGHLALLGYTSGKK